MRWEGHTLLMTDEFFRPSLVHLLVLIPKGNMKTTWEAALADLHLLTVPAPRSFFAAADKGQAKELYDFATHFVDSEPEIGAHLISKPSTLEIRRADSPGRFALKILAQDDSKHGGKKQGLNLTLGGGDEIHAWQNRNLFVDLRSGGFKRREAARLAGDPLWHSLGKLATITTEGYDSDGLLAEELVKFLGDPKHGVPPMGTVETGLRVLHDGSVEHHPDGRLTIACYGEEEYVDERTGQTYLDGLNVLLMWANREDDDTSDNAVVKLANPASVATLGSINDARTSLTPWEFLRYRCNIRTLGFESWIPAGSWDSLYDPRVPIVTHRYWNDATDEELDAYVDSLYAEGAPIVGHIDMARYADCAAVTTIGPLSCPDCDEESEECESCDGTGELGKRVPRTIVWRGSKDSPVPYAPVYRAARRLAARYDLQALGLDPKYLDEMYETLENGDAENPPLPVESVSQSNERQSIAAKSLRRSILNERKFAHDGDPILSAHVMAAIAKDVGTDQFKLAKSKDSGPPIDACVALSFANELDGLDHAGEPLAGWG